MLLPPAAYRGWGAIWSLWPKQFCKCVQEQNASTCPSMLSSNRVRVEGEYLQLLNKILWSHFIFYLGLLGRSLILHCTFIPHSHALCGKLFHSGKGNCEQAGARSRSFPRDSPTITRASGTTWIFLGHIFNFLYCRMPVETADQSLFNDDSMHHWQFDK